MTLLLGPMMMALPFGLVAALKRPALLANYSVRGLPSCTAADGLPKVRASMPVRS
jgi:hypothetical protein